MPVLLSLYFIHQLFLRIVITVQLLSQSHMRFQCMPLSDTASFPVHGIQQGTAHLNESCLLLSDFLDRLQLFLIHTTILIPHFSLNFLIFFIFHCQFLWSESIALFFEDSPFLFIDLSNIGLLELLLLLCPFSF